MALQSKVGQLSPEDEFLQQLLNRPNESFQATTPEELAINAAPNGVPGAEAPGKLSSFLSNLSFSPETASAASQAPDSSVRNVLPNEPPVPTSAPKLPTNELSPEGQNYASLLNKYQAAVDKQQTSLPAETTGQKIGLFLGGLAQGIGTNPSSGSDYVKQIREEKRKEFTAKNEAEANKLKTQLGIAEERLTLPEKVAKSAEQTESLKDLNAPAHPLVKSLLSEGSGRSMNDPMFAGMTNRQAEKILPGVLHMAGVKATRDATAATKEAARTDKIDTEARKAGFQAGQVITGTATRGAQSLYAQWTKRLNLGGLLHKFFDAASNPKIPESERLILTKAVVTQFARNYDSLVSSGGSSAELAKDLANQMGFSTEGEIKNFWQRVAGKPETYMTPALLANFEKEVTVERQTMEELIQDSILSTADNLELHYPGSGEAERFMQIARKKFAHEPALLELLTNVELKADQRKNQAAAPPSEPPQKLQVPGADVKTSTGFKLKIGVTK